MRTSRAFSDNPIGVLFDPTLVHESFKTGADFSMPRKDIRAGRYLPEQIANFVNRSSHSH